MAEMVKRHMDGMSGLGGGNFVSDSRDLHDKALSQIHAGNNHRPTGKQTHTQLV
jgi:hypothetical protein